MTPIAALDELSAPVQEAEQSPVNSHELEFNAWLARTFEALDQGQVLEMGDAFGRKLSHLYFDGQKHSALPQMANLIKAHPLHAACMQDPYTKRAFEKPRGYAGDAVMLDYIYRPEQGAAHMASEGNGAAVAAQTVYGVTTLGPSGLSIRYRRELLRSHIDQTVAISPQARILSVAAGHCRELDDCLLRKIPHQAEFVAFDQDPDSCAEVRASYGAPWLKVVEGNVKQLLRDSTDLGQFDLIYSAGLYDYLPDALATGLTDRLRARLKPGGQLLLANFLPDCHGRGYMELVMEWSLLWRTPDQFKALLPADMQAAAQLTVDPHRNVVYATWTKPSA